MNRASRPADAPLADAAVDVTLSGPLTLADGFRPYQRYRVTVPRADGSPTTQTRDILRGGRVIGVVPIDPERGEIVLIRQFRLAAHLASGKGELIEIVAGLVDGNETVAEAARRECLEEIGVAPTRLVELFSFFPTPGLTDELATVFLAVVDASAVPERAGAAAEGEEIKPLRVDIDHAIAALAQGRISNGLLIIALQWLALNRERLPAALRPD
ncbi:MAG: NUDIX domain-containing protein [Xanthobacteraceae bacterium]